MKWSSVMGGFVLAGALVAAGCQSSAKPELSRIYDRAAQDHDGTRNPVIVIPGILGSRLVDDASGRLVWGAFGGDAADPGRADGAALVALPMDDGVPLRDLRDGVRSDGALDRLDVSLLGVPVQLNAYRNILGTLGVGGYRDETLGLSGAVDYGEEHFTCFQFDYDWRRDNIENARRLHEFIEEKSVYVARERAKRFGVTDEPVVFDIVAHSMGGLISRYYLRYGGAEPPEDGSVPELTWAGAPRVSRLILVATPSAGSATAVTQLTEGTQFAFFLPKYTATVLGTMPSIYQLLPRPRHHGVVDAATGEAIDILDPDEWEQRQWGLADPHEDRSLAMLLPEHTPAERRAIAIAHQRRCLNRAKQFFRALDEPAAPPAGVAISLVAGDAVPTLAVVGVDASNRPEPLEEGPGDGTVLRSSALMDERVGGVWQRTLVTPVAWDHVTFLFDDHLGLTKSPVFVDNVLYQLLEAPRP